MGQLVSECCGANAWFSLGEVHGIYLKGSTYIGVCSDCKEDTLFQDITNEEEDD
tara:strand:+ start:102 stop:263 length:162 start_codon:yes stop_codon:yes gene_type:complete